MSKCGESWLVLFAGYRRKSRKGQAMRVISLALAKVLAHCDGLVLVAQGPFLPIMATLMAFFGHASGQASH